MGTDTTEHRIDNTDFAILFAVQKHDVPPWKNKIHGWIVDKESQLPIDNSVSVQTVGRRVDALVQNDYLETVIVSPDEIKRDLIIAFKLTDKGVGAVEKKREDLLKEATQETIFGSGSANPVTKPAFITLLIDKFGWSEDMREPLHSDYDVNELATFLVMTYIEAEAANTLNDEQMQRFQDVLAQYDIEDTFPGTGEKVEA